MPASKAQLRVVRGDITQQNVDAIVNAANAELVGGGGVDGAIHAAAGPELMEACRAHGCCPTGSAVFTPGYALPATYVIHAVGPIWQGGLMGEALLLESCYRKCMEIAAALQLRSIAFSAISCGVYGYPIDQAANIAVQTVTKMAADCPTLKQIDFVCFGDQVSHAYQPRIPAGVEGLTAFTFGFQNVVQLFFGYLQVKSLHADLLLDHDGSTGAEALSANAWRVGGTDDHI